MTAADVASINLHSDVYHVLQLMSPHDTAATKEHEVNLHSMMCSTIGMYVILSNVNQQNFFKQFQHHSYHLLLYWHQQVVQPSSHVHHVIERFHERMDRETMTAIFRNELPEPEVGRRRFHGTQFATEGSQPKEHI